MNVEEEEMIGKGVKEGGVRENVEFEVKEEGLKWLD